MLQNEFEQILETACVKLTTEARQSPTHKIIELFENLKFLNNSIKKHGFVRL
jgi:hypothetical protein